MKKPGSEGGYHIVRYLFPSFGRELLLAESERPHCVCLFVILGSGASFQLGRWRGGPISVGSTLSLSRVVFTLTPFPPSLRIRGWISEFPSLFPPPPPPPCRGPLCSSEPFSRETGRKSRKSRRVSAEGRKGINISESRSLRRKFEPRRRRTRRSFPPFPSS